MKISIVIPAFNEARLLRGVLQTISAAAGVFTGKGWEVEKIVCDNNSTDGTSQIAAEEGYTVVFEPINQIGRARNTGAKAASGDWLIFIDADSYPTPDLFKEVSRAISCGKYVAGGATVVLDKQTRVGNFVVGVWNIFSRFSHWAAGSFIFCRAGAFRAIGGFDQSLYASEELDLSRRLKRFGRKEGKRMVILTSAPLQTSARKTHLYSWREHGGFILKAMLRPGKVLSNRDACFTWYDGRR